MEFWSRRSESRVGKIYNKLKLKGNRRDSFNASNPDRIASKFLNSGIIDDDDDDAEDGIDCCIGSNRETKISDETSNSISISDSKSNSTLKRQFDGGRSGMYDTTSCKPCSVILERMSEEDLKKLSSMSNFGVKNIKKKNNPQKTLRAQELRPRVRGLDGRLLFSSYSSSTSQTPKENDIDKPGSSVDAKKPNNGKNGGSSGRQTKSNDKSRACRSDERTTTSCHPFIQEKLTADHLDTKNEVSNQNGSSMRGPEDSEIEVLPSTRTFRLSLKKNISNTRENEACRRDSSTRIIKRTDSSAKDKQDPSGSTPKSGDNDNIEPKRLSSHDSRVRASPRFRLSLKEKRNSTKDDEAHGRDPPREVSQLEDSEEVNESDVLELNHLKRLIKRRSDDTEGDEASVSKLKKYRENEDSTDQNRSEADQLDLRTRKTSSLRPPNQNSRLQGPMRVVDNRKSTQIICSGVQNEAPIVKNARVSLVKLEPRVNLRRSERDKNVEVLDRCIDRRCEPVNDCQIQITDTQSKELAQSCSNKTKDTKITDYFFKIDKNKTLSHSNSTDSNQGARDLLLKKKHGILRDPIVLLIDFQKLKVPKSKYSASEIEKLTQEYAKSSVVNKPTSTIVDLPSSSLIPGANLSLNPAESSTNYEELPTSRTTPIAKNLSSRGLNSQLMKKRLQVVTTHDSINDDHSVHPKYELHIDVVPVSDNQLSARCRSPQMKKHLPDETTQDALRDHSFVDTCTTPRSKSGKNTLDNTERVNKDLDLNQEVPNKDSSHQKSSELKAILHSSPTTAKKGGNHSPRSQIKNTTPKSTETSYPQLRKLILSPEKRITLINNEILLNEPEVQVTDVTRKSPKTIGTQKRVDDTSRKDSLNTLPNCNEPRKKSDTTSTIINGDTNDPAERQPHTSASISSVLKSPTNPGISTTHLRLGTPSRLPVNSMTIVSREMMEENNYWLGLDNTINNDLTENRTTDVQDNTIEKNASADISPSNSKTKEKSRTCSNTTSNVDNNSSPKSRITHTMDNLSPKQLACTNIGTYSSELNVPTGSGVAQEKNDGTQKKDSVLQKETTPVPDIQSSKPISSVQDQVNPIAIERVDLGCENSKIQDEVSSDSQQENQLLIDTDESDSESLAAEHTLPGTSTTGCLNSNANTSLQNEDADTNKPVIARQECAICQKICRSFAGLEQHMRLHVKHTVSCCPICDKPLSRRDALEHYLQHSQGGEFGFHHCSMCEMKFRKKSSLTGHLRTKHNVGKNRLKSKIDPTSKDYNKCTICQVAYNSKEELFSHVIKHTPQELQDAFAVEKAKLELLSSETTVCQNEDGQTPEKETTQESEEKSSKSTETNDPSATSPPPVASFDVSICMCHKDERLEIAGGAIIEIALTCMECKTFFKTRKCFKDHYNSTSCKWSDKTVVSPTMFCNKCCTILNNLQDMHGHLTKHGTVDVDTKTSVYCKFCNIFFFGIGSLFYAHWSEHRKNPLFLADHFSFPKNTKVKIVELGGPQPAQQDEPTESLFIADHQCQNCERPFQSEEELKKHLKSCSKKGDSESQAIENPKSVWKLICSICNKEFADKSTFDSHIGEHDTIKDLLQAPKSLDKSLGDNQLTCSICQTEYETVKSYKEHLVRHEVIQQKFLCDYCTLMMDSVEDFELHCAEHKGTPEKPVSCKVIFAINKFHCKVCKIGLDNQSVLDEHLATHTNSITPIPNLLENLTTEIVPATEKKCHSCTTCHLEFDDQLKLDAHAATHNEDPLGHSIEDPVVIHLSDDSNSTDIEIVATKVNGESEVPIVGKILLEEQQDGEQQETANAPEPKKPAFLRVKNLKELLPYACSKCKSEFDTQINLSKHVCKQNAAPVRSKGYNYFCKICKSFPCDNASDWNLHVLSHFPLNASQKFNGHWFHLVKMQGGQQIFKCAICQNYDSLTIHTLRDHFITHHRDIYHPIFTCRVCHTFKTDIEEEIRRHEAAHFQQSSSRPPITYFANNLLSPLSVENSYNYQQLPSFISSGNNASIPQPVENLNRSDKPKSMQHFVNSSNNLPPAQPVENSNNLQQPVPNQSAIGSGNNSSSIQSVQNFTNSQQLGPTLHPSNGSNNFLQKGSTPPVTTSGNNVYLLPPPQSSNNFQQPGHIRQPDNNSVLQQSSSIPPVINTVPELGPLQPADNANNLQQTLWIPPVVTAVDELSSIQSTQSFNESHEPVQTLQPDNSSNNFQPSIPVSSVTTSGSNLSSIQPVDNSNELPQPVTIPHVTSSGNNLVLKYVINAVPPGPILQSVDRPNNAEQSISAPPVTSAASSSLAPLQSMDNAQWLSTTPQTLQLQITGASPLNNMTNVMHTLPLYVANMGYCCRICKNYKCSTEQELKAHESLHEFIQLGEPSKRLFQCKLCTSIFFSTQDQLRAHMDTCHKAKKSNVSHNQTQTNVIDTPSKCTHCLQTFSSSVQLMQHVHTSHTLVNQQQNNHQFKNAYPYPCQICSIGFLNEAFLQAHMRQIHPNVKLSRQKLNDPKTLYQCDTCGLLLISEATLSYHMRSHNMGFQ